ncbi:MAG: TauD/TfdA family dioxygenase [Acidimicrobiia bacterium]|nr:TauD/TfdA family dioxygenase [Acidimicrobiia bacterium]
MDAAFRNSPLSHRRIATHPIASAMGAEVSDVDLARLDDEQFEEIRRALYHHGLLSFRGQRLDHGDQEALTVRFGPHGVDAFTDGVVGHPDIQPVVREPGPELPIFFGANWHTDSPFLPQPPAISMLRSVEVPPYGGDTLFTSTRLAYERLSPGMRELLSGLRGLYTRAHLTRAKEQWDDDPSRRFDLSPVERDLTDATSHPLVRTHPETGTRSLYVDVNYTIGIEGLHRAEAAPILDYLVRHTTQPAFTCRVRWEPDMVVMWDNRLVLHQAFDDFAGYRREMYRSTVLGEVPR